MDIIWGEETFLFKAFTVCAVALFGGVTLHSAANSISKNIPDEMMNTWEQVHMLIIDEVSFSPEDQKDKLNACLNHVQRKLTGGNEVFISQHDFWSIFNYFLWRFSSIATCQIKRESIVVCKLWPLGKFYQCFNCFEQQSQIQG